MSIKPPFTAVEVRRAASGFYQGHSVEIALLSKGIMVALVIWALVWPANANSNLSSLNWWLLEVFNVFYIIIVGMFAFFLAVVAILPKTGKRKMGRTDEAPEFSNFSWFSMMFGAGLGVGLMVFATAEPLGLWGSNPETVSGAVAPNSQEAFTSGYRYTFLHYGFHAWAIYVVTGLSLAYYAYTRDMPLTIGFGVSQFVDGVYAITGAGWLMDMAGDVPKPGTVGLIAGLVCIMGLSIISAVSGVGRGVKYLSNLNLVLSLILLFTFVLFGSFAFAMTTYATAFVDYLLHFVSLSFGAYGTQSPEAFVMALPEAAKPLADELIGGATNAWGSYDGFKSGLEGAAAALDEATLTAVYAAGEPERQFGWQAGWTTFYWAWWIAFSPFVGLFLARISRGRTVREFILGCVFAPAMVCFAWMTILGATAIDMELTGGANGAIIGASNTNKLFVTLGQMIEGGLLSALTVMCVVLIMTFLVTSADSGILVMNTIMSGGDQDIGNKHKIVWGLILTAVIGTLLVAGATNTGADPMEALKNVMIIGALPFTMVMGLMVLSLTKALYRDSARSSSEDGSNAATE